MSLPPLTSRPSSSAEQYTSGTRVAVGHRPPRRAGSLPTMTAATAVPWPSLSSVPSCGRM